jgi:hypothetical protein
MNKARRAIFWGLKEVDYFKQPPLLLVSKKEVKGDGRE